MPNLPKFENKLTEKLIRPEMDQDAQGGYGIILEYDALNNTATVLLSNRGSDEPGQTYNDVPCPTSVGIQGVAPEAGRPCWVTFKDNSYVYPIITNYFNHIYQTIDYQRQTKAVNSTPRFMFNT